jgi:hypothetical protein
VQLLTRSNRRAGCMTRGPGSPCWARWSRRGVPTWHGCMPPAWLSALSPAGLGESGEVLVTAGWLHAPCAWRFDFFSPGPACITCGTQPPHRGGENLGACRRRLNPRRLRTQVGRVAFKKGGDPLGGQPCPSRSPHASCLSIFRAPRMGDARNPSALSSEERNFVEVGTFQPSFGFKDFHQAARLHPLAGGHPRR